jgi:tetratricopeptide (TPR) repeat protein
LVYVFSPIVYCGIILLMVTKKRRVTKKRILIALGALLAIAAIVAAVLYYSFAISDSKKTTKELTPEEKVSEVIQTVETGKDVKTAQTELQQLADKEPDTTKKIVYLSGAADVSFNSGDFKSALKVNENIESLQQSALSAGNIAQAYFEMGDYRNAVKYYEIAISRSEKPASETERAPYNDYTILKREAEAKIQ